MSFITEIDDDGSEKSIIRPNYIVPIEIESSIKVINTGMKVAIIGFNGISDAEYVDICFPISYIFKLKEIIDNLIDHIND